MEKNKKPFKREYGTKFENEVQTEDLHSSIMKAFGNLKSRITLAFSQNKDLKKEEDKKRQEELAESHAKAEQKSIEEQNSKEQAYEYWRNQQEENRRFDEEEAKRRAEAEQFNPDSFQEAGSGLDCEEQEDRSPVGVGNEILHRRESFGSIQFSRMISATGEKNYIDFYNKFKQKRKQAAFDSIDEIHKSEKAAREDDIKRNPLPDPTGKNNDRNQLSDPTQKENYKKTPSFNNSAKTSVKTTAKDIASRSGKAAAHYAKSQFKAAKSIVSELADADSKPYGDEEETIKNSVYSPTKTAIKSIGVQALGSEAARFALMNKIRASEAESILNAAKKIYANDEAAFNNFMEKFSFASNKKSYESLINEIKIAGGDEKATKRLTDKLKNLQKLAGNGYKRDFMNAVGGINGGITAMAAPVAGFVTKGVKESDAGSGYNRLKSDTAIPVNFVKKQVTRPFDRLKKRLANRFREHLEELWKKKHNTGKQPQQQANPQQGGGPGPESNPTPDVPNPTPDTPNGANGGVPNPNGPAKTPTPTKNVEGTLGSSRKIINTPDRTVGISKKIGNSSRTIAKNSTQVAQNSGRIAASAAKNTAKVAGETAKKTAEITGKAVKTTATVANTASAAATSANPWGLVIEIIVAILSIVIVCICCTCLYNSLDSANELVSYNTGFFLGSDNKGVTDPNESFAADTIYLMDAYLTRNLSYIYARGINVYNTSARYHATGLGYEEEGSAYTDDDFVKKVAYQAMVPYEYFYIDLGSGVLGKAKDNKKTWFEGGRVCTLQHAAQEKIDPLSGANISPADRYKIVAINGEKIDYTSSGSLGDWKVASFDGALKSFHMVKHPTAMNRDDNLIERYVFDIESKNSVFYTDIDRSIVPNLNDITTSGDPNNGLETPFENAVFDNTKEIVSMAAVFFDNKFNIIMDANGEISEPDPDADTSELDAMGENGYGIDAKQFMAYCYVMWLESHYISVIPETANVNESSYFSGGTAEDLAVHKVFDELNEDQLGTKAGNEFFITMLGTDLKNMYLSNICHFTSIAHGVKTDTVAIADLDETSAGKLIPMKAANLVTASSTSDWTEDIEETSTNFIIPINKLRYFPETYHVGLYYLDKDNNTPNSENFGKMYISQFDYYLPQDESHTCIDKNGVEQQCYSQTLRVDKKNGTPVCIVCGTEIPGASHYYPYEATNNPESGETYSVNLPINSNINHFPLVMNGSKIKSVDGAYTPFSASLLYADDTFNSFYVNGNYRDYKVVASKLSIWNYDTVVNSYNDNLPNTSITYTDVWNSKLEPATVEVKDQPNHINEQKKNILATYDEDQTTKQSFYPSKFLDSTTTYNFKNFRTDELLSNRNLSEEDSLIFNKDILEISETKTFPNNDNPNALDGVTEQEEDNDPSGSGDYYKFDAGTPIEKVGQIRQHGEDDSTPVLYDAKMKGHVKDQIKRASANMGVIEDVLSRVFYSSFVTYTGFDIHNTDVTASPYNDYSVDLLYCNRDNATQNTQSGTKNWLGWVRNRESYDYNNIDEFEDHPWYGNTTVPEGSNIRSDDNNYVGDFFMTDCATQEAYSGSISLERIYGSNYFTVKGNKNVIKSVVCDTFTTDADKIDESLYLPDESSANSSVERARKKFTDYFTANGGYVADYFVDYGKEPGSYGKIAAIVGTVDITDGSHEDLIKETKYDRYVYTCIYPDNTHNVDVYHMVDCPVRATTSSNPHSNEQHVGTHTVVDSYKQDPDNPGQDYIDPDTGERVPDQTHEEFDSWTCNTCGHQNGENTSSCGGEVKNYDDGDLIYTKYKSKTIYHIPSKEFVGFYLCGGHTQVVLMPTVLSFSGSKNLFDIELKQETMESLNLDGAIFGRDIGRYSAMWNYDPSADDIERQNIINNRTAAMMAWEENWEYKFQTDKDTRLNYDVLATKSDEVIDGLKDNTELWEVLKDYFNPGQSSLRSTYKTYPDDKRLQYQYQVVFGQTNMDSLTKIITDEDYDDILEMVENELEEKGLDKMSDDISDRTGENEYENRFARVDRALSFVGKIGYSQACHDWRNQTAIPDYGDLCYKTDCNGYAGAVIGLWKSYGYDENGERTAGPDGNVHSDRDDIVAEGGETFTTSSSAGSKEVKYPIVRTGTGTSVIKTRADFKKVKPGDLVYSGGHVMVYICTQYDEANESNDIIYFCDCTGASKLGPGGVEFRGKTRSEFNEDYYTFVSVDQDLKEVGDPALQRTKIIKTQDDD